MWSSPWLFFPQNSSEGPQIYHHYLRNHGAPNLGLNRWPLGFNNTLQITNWWILNPAPWLLPNVTGGWQKLLWPKDLTDFYWKKIFIVRISSWKISSTSNIPMGHWVIICFQGLKRRRMMIEGLHGYIPTKCSCEIHSC